MEEEQKASEAPAAAPAKGKGMWIGIVVAVIVIVILLAAVFGGFFKAPTRKLAQELWYNNDGHYGDTEPALATVLKSDIEACGQVSVTLKSDTWAVYKQNWAQQKMPLFLLGWYPDYFDTDDYISPFLSVSGAASLGSFYNNSQVDQWVTSEQTTTSPTQRTQLFTDIQNKLADDVPYVPLFTGNAHAAYVNTVQNVVLHPVSFKWFIIDKPGAAELNASTSDKIISLDPASAYDYMSIEIINNVFDTLLVYDPWTTDLRPGLATTIPTVANGGVSADGKTFTYHLRPGIMFSDGTALNATVVKRSIDRAIRLNIAGSAAFLLYDVGALGRDASNGNNTAPGVITVAPNNLDITFQLARPVSFFNDLMAFSAAAPVHWNYSQTAEQPSTVASVIGSGPYRMTQHTQNTLVVLETNPNYYGTILYASIPNNPIAAIPVMNKVNINIRATATNLKQDIETKAVDVAYRTLTPSDLTDLQTRATALGLTVDVGASPQIRYLVFNVNLVPDVRIRQAIAYSVNRANIRSVVFNGLVDPLYSMVPPSFQYQAPVFQTQYGAAPSCTQANALLDLAGYHIFLPRTRVARDER